MIINNKEWFNILNNLSLFGNVFYKLWSVGKPIFDDKIPTAEVRFDSLGDCIQFVFNEKFYDSLSFEQKLFVVSHEMLHILYFHGKRIIALHEKEQEKYSQIRANTAADLIVNERLVNYFNFEKSLMTNGYFLSTYFKDAENYALKSLEELYYLLEDKIKDNQPQGFDIHNMSGTELDAIKKFIEKHLSKEDLKEIEESFLSLEAGTGSSEQFKIINIDKPVKKKKWETVIKRWVNNKLDSLIEDTWIYKNRRYSLLSDNLFLPNELDLDNVIKDKINIHMYLDTSGSCVHLGERFFKAALSIPTEHFNIRVFCFDTSVYETTLESKKLYGFGGTAFNIIENNIIKLCKNNQKYPEAVFIITDGWAPKFECKFPKKWHWFLTDNNSKSSIPNGSYIYNLCDYE